MRRRLRWTQAPNGAESGGDGLPMGREMGICKTLLGAAAALTLLTACDQTPADPIPPPPQTPVDGPAP